MSHSRLNLPVLIGALAALVAAAACASGESSDLPERPRALHGTWRVDSTVQFDSTTMRWIAELALDPMVARFTDSTSFMADDRRRVLVWPDATTEYGAWRVAVDSATNRAVLTLVPHGIGMPPERYHLRQQADTLWMQSTRVGSMSEPPPEVYRLVRVPGSGR